MLRLLRKLWNDDAGAILAVEWTLLAGVMVFGVTAGAVMVRDAVNAQMQAAAETLSRFAPSQAVSAWRPATTPQWSATAQPPFVCACPMPAPQAAPPVLIQQWNLLPAP